MFKIIPISSEIVKNSAPSFYHKDGTFYALHLKKGKENNGIGSSLRGHIPLRNGRTGNTLKLNQNKVGLLGIKKLTQENAELELLIFTPYRHKVLTKRRCAQMLLFPFTQGFKWVIIGTELKSMQRLCRRFEMDFMCQNDGKSWFVKERGH